MPDVIKLNPPAIPHELAVYDETAPDQVAARIAEADVVITNKVKLGARPRSRRRRSCA